MKKLLPIFLLIASGSILVAQPTLTVNNFVPIAGESQLYYIADSSNTVNNVTGANVLFDYSGLTGLIATQTTHYVSPSVTQHGSDFPTASYADTTSGVPINKRYSELRVDSLVNVGIVAQINTFGTAVGKYDVDPEVTMRFPFNFGDSFSDDYEGTFTATSVPLPTSGEGTVNVSADAWGTLRVPGSPDIDSVLRIVQIESFLTDTIFLQPLFPNILPVPVNATIVSYYKPSLSKFALLSFLDANAGGQITKNVISQYPIPAGVNDIKNNIDVNVFPNPSKNNTTTVSLNLERSSKVSVELKNQLGQLVQSVFEGTIQQKEIKTNTSKLTKGIYFININSEDQVISKKLIIQ